MKPENKKKNTVRVLVCIIGLIVLVVGANVHMTYEYERAVGAEMQMAYKAPSIEVCLHHLNKTLETLDEHFNEDDYTSWWQTPKNTIAFEKEKIEGIIARLLILQEHINEVDNNTFLNSSQIVIKPYVKFKDIRNHIDDVYIYNAWALNKRPGLYWGTWPVITLGFGTIPFIQILGMFYWGRWNDQIEEEKRREREKREMEEEKKRKKKERKRLEKLLEQGKAKKCKKCGEITEYMNKLFCSECFTDFKAQKPFIPIGPPPRGPIGPSGPSGL